MILKNGNSYKFYYQCTKKLSSHSLSPPYWLGLVLPQLLRGLSCSDASALSPDMHCIQYVQSRILNLCISAIRLPSCRASYIYSVCSNAFQIFALYWCICPKPRDALYTSMCSYAFQIFALYWCICPKPRNALYTACAVMHLKSLHFSDTSALNI